MCYIAIVIIVRCDLVFVAKICTLTYAPHVLLLGVAARKDIPEMDKCMVRFFVQSVGSVVCALKLTLKSTSHAFCDRAR
jgi:hypothetical protein